MSAGSAFKRAGRSLARPTVYLSILLLVFAVIIWFLGPLIGYGEVRPLAPASVRLALLLLLALVWGLGGLLTRTRRSQEEQALLAGLRRQQEERDAEADRESADIDRRLRNFRAAARAARSTLGTSRLFGSSAYAMPWYVMLGAQGSGKTALSAGLKTSATREDREDEHRDAANFHFSDDVVLVELDGAFIEQEQNWAKRIWPSVLDQLRSLRPRQPLNGIILTIGADDLLRNTPEALLDLAAGARRRIDEIGARLRTRAPVYVVVTKLDVLLGFEEFFENLPAEERESAFGFPINALNAQAQPSDAFDAGFAGLLDHLGAQVMMRLYEEPDEVRRRHLNELPAQFALLKPRLMPIVQHLCGSSRFATAPLVRGLFFASAHQTNDFIDITAPALAGDFAYGKAGLEPPAQQHRPRSRPFFVQGLLQQVMLPEKGVAGLTRPGRVLMQLQGIGANIALAIGTIVLLTLWWLAFTEGRAYISRLDDGVGDASQSLSAAAPDGAVPTSFEPVLDVLDDLRYLRQEEPRRTTALLYSTGSVEEASELTYEKALSEMALPFLWRYLRDGLDTAETPASLRLQQLKLYLMLGGERPVDEATARLIAADFAGHWLPYDRSPEIEAAVADHLAEFARAEIAAPMIDLSLVDRARARISDYTLARVAYDLALAMPSVRERPAWRPVDHMGAAGPQALSRVTGKSMWDGIAGIYTRDALGAVMLPVSGDAASRLVEDLWVMGMADTVVDRERESRRIRDGLLDLYRVDYITQWESLLSDLDIVQAETAGELARAMALVVGSPSPIKELASAIAAETHPAEASGSPLDLVPGASARLQAGLPQATELQQAQVDVFAPRRVVDVAGAISNHFKPFRDAVHAAEGQQAQIDGLIAAMEPLYRQINHVAIGGDVLELGTDPQTLLAALTERVTALPESLQAFFRRVLNKAAAVTSGSSRERLAEVWNTRVLPLCTATTSGRYPFSPTSRRDTSLADFASLFGPKGAIANFRNDYLRPFIDTNAKPWRWRTGQQFGLDLDDRVLSQFELADEITTAYFGEAETPQVAFTVEPVSLDSKARAFQFDIGGPTLTYSHGPPTPAAFTWPPANPAAEAILSMTPELDGQRNMLRFQGPWALFRLFDAGRILAPDSSDVVPYQFNIGGRSLRMLVTAPPSRNPFARDILSDFSCPELR